ncbi:MAG: DUF4905 domain-containing protein [Bacteroidia bacterium]|nr:DUF4905 domain-containing protein [Bacteroidia bacterium]
MNSLQQKKFQSIIWKVIPDTANELLMVELRKKQDQQVEYGFLDLQQGFYQKLISTRPCSWWTGMLDFFDNVVLIHGYEDEGLPVQMGVEAHQLKPNKFLWKNSQDSVEQTGVESLRMKSGEILEWRSGEVIKREDFEPLEGVRAAQQVFPKLYLQESEVFQHWKTSLGDFLGDEPSLQLALANHGHTYIIQAYTGNLQEDLKAYWLLYHAQARTFTKLISVSQQSLLMDPFFVQLPYLFFLPTSNEIFWTRI